MNVFFIFSNENCLFTFPILFLFVIYNLNFYKIARYYITSKSVILRLVHKNVKKNNTHISTFPTKLTSPLQQRAQS